MNITREELKKGIERAKVIFRDFENFGTDTIRSFGAALDAILPPKAEGWIEISRTKHEIRFEKGVYQLYWFTTFHPPWRLYATDDLSIRFATFDTPYHCDSEAQAWADKRIAVLEQSKTIEAATISMKLKKCDDPTCFLCNHKKLDADLYFILPGIPGRGKQEALREAEQLAQLNPGTTYYIAKVTTKVKLNTTSEIQIEEI
jgi:hypothetical protein